MLSDALFFLLVTNTPATAMITMTVAAIRTIFVSRPACCVVVGVEEGVFVGVDSVVGDGVSAEVGVDVGSIGVRV